MALHKATFEPCDFDAVKLLAGRQVADLEAEQSIDVHEAERAAAVDRERPDGRRERSDLADNLVGLRVRNAKQRGLQSGKVGMSAVEADDGVVRAGVGHELLEDIAAQRVDDVPVLLLEGRKVNELSVGGDTHPVATSFVRLFPENFLRHEVEALQRPQRADVQPSGGRAGTDPFDVERGALLVEAGGGDALDELVVALDVEHQHAVPAILEVIADAGLGDVKELAGGGGGADGDRRQEDEQEQSKTRQRQRRSAWQERKAGVPPALAAKRPRSLGNLGWRLLSPGGSFENSPAVHCRVQIRHPTSPEGTAEFIERHASVHNSLWWQELGRPFGT